MREGTIRFRLSEDLPELDIYLDPHPMQHCADVVVIDEPICPLCLRSGAACHCWEDDS